MTDHKTIELMGSGEFEPWSEEVDRFSLSRAEFGDGSVVILPTASAPEGDEVFNRWAGMGLDHYKRMGVHARVVDLKTREDAFLDVLIEELANPSMIFFSGGNPSYLASGGPRSPGAAPARASSASSRPTPRRRVWRTSRGDMASGW